MAKVAVIGLGNIGTVFAANLIAGGRHDVAACVRHPVGELIVQHAESHIAVLVNCVTDPGVVSPVDWVLLCVKSQDTPSAAPWLEGLRADGTRIAILQNGVTPHSELGTVVPTIVYTNSKRLGPGRVRHMRPKYDLGVPDSPDGHDLVELFEGTNILVNPEQDFVTAAWRKFLINLAANPLTAIVGRGIGVLRQPDIEALARDLLGECVAIGRACGAKLDDRSADEVLQWLAGFPGDVGTSMLEDRQAGRPLEHEAITGTVVRLGREHGIPTPVNSLILALLRGLDPLPYESPISSTSK